jgi:hypothetical protein
MTTATEPTDSLDRARPKIPYTSPVIVDMGAADVLTAGRMYGAMADGPGYRTYWKGPPGGA